MIRCLVLSLFAVVCSVMLAAQGVASRDGVDVVGELRIVVGGDFMQHAPQVERARHSNGRYDYTTSMQYVAPAFRAADIAILNLETTLSVKGPYTGYPCFCSPVEVADVMVDMGIDLVALANNHCCDRLARGIRSTTEALDRRQLRRIGAYRDAWDYRQNRVQYISCEGINLAFVNLTYGTNGIPVPKGCVVDMLERDNIIEVLQSIDRTRVDCIVAIVHWGNEYERRQNRQQEQIEALLRENGVDVIIGSHPHVVQPYWVDSVEGVTLYSLGNFVSNQHRRYCDGGLVATIDITKLSSGELRYDATVEPVWVRLRDYAVIPKSVGDTLKLNRVEREEYNLFMSDTYKILPARGEE